MSKPDLAGKRAACYIGAMAAQVLFNSLAYIDRLTRGGFSPEQARASAEALETAFSESVATKSDVMDAKRELQSSIDALRHETTASIDALRHDTASSIDGVKHEISLLKHDFETLRRDVAESEGRLRLEFKRDISESETRVRLEIAQSKNETLRWMFGFVIVLIGAIFTIVKFVR